MKKLFRTLLCATVLALSLSFSAFAAEPDLLISPNPNAVPEKQGDFYVLVNGGYATFPDAVPQIKNDRSCLPFVAVFDQLGFAEEDMTWDGATSTVTAAKDGLTISLTIGKNQITLIQDGETKVIETDVAPYIDPALSRTYVPFGLVADALGYNVGWDAGCGAVIIDDVDAILAANTETYELMDKYLAYNKTFLEKNQKVAGGYTMLMGMGDMASAMEFVITGEYEMLTSGAAAMQFETDMVMDMAVTAEGEDVTDETLGEEADIFPLTLDMEMRADMNSGMFYFQSAALADMMGQPDMAGAWYKLDLGVMFDQLSGILGMDCASLMALSTGMVDMSFEEYLAATLKMMLLTDVGLTTGEYLDMLNLFLADSAFGKSGTKYVNEINLGEIDEYGNQATMTLTLHTSGSKVNGYDMVMSAGSEESGTLIELKASMKNGKMEAEFGIAAESAGSVISMIMSMDGEYQTTTKVPATEPPADAVVVDLMGLLGA